MDIFITILSLISLFGGIVYGIITMFKKKFKRGFSIIGIGFLSFIVFAFILGVISPKTEDEIAQEKARSVADAKIKADKEAKAKEKEEAKAAEEAKAKADAEAQAKEKAKADAHQANIDALAKNLEDRGLDKKEAEYDAEYVIDLQNSGKWTAKKAEDWLEEQVQNKKYVDWRDSQFSRNGSIDPLVQAVKDSMNNPKSFDHYETTYEDLPNHAGFKARMVFMGTNEFGGVVKNSVVATFNYKDNTFTYQFE